jgi:hypothetical protein
MVLWFMTPFNLEAICSSQTHQLDFTVTKPRIPQYVSSPPRKPQILYYGEWHLCSRVLWGWRGTEAEYRPRKVITLFCFLFFFREMLSRHDSEVSFYFVPSRRLRSETDIFNPYYAWCMWQKLPSLRRRTVEAYVTVLFSQTAYISLGG